MTLTLNSACTKIYMILWNITKTQTNFMVSRSLLAWIMDTQGDLSLEGLVQYLQVWDSLEDFVLSFPRWRWVLQAASGEWNLHFQVYLYGLLLWCHIILGNISGNHGSSQVHGFPMSCDSKQVLDSRLVSKMGACTSWTVCSLWSRGDGATYSY